MSRLLKPLGCFGMLVLLLLIAPGAAHAVPVTFNFNHCGGGATGNCGASTTYNVGGFSIVATAEGAGVGNLFAKNNGGDENGLGLTNDPSHDNEITPGFFIQLDISSILANDPLSIILDSSTSPDAWSVYDTNTSGSMTLGSTVKTGANEIAFTINPGDRYLDITATNGNVLLSSLSFNTAATPEPSGLVLLGTGILGLAGAARRKLKV